MVQMVPAGKVFPPVLLFCGLGAVALVLMPYVLGLPSGRKSLAEYSRDIRLWPMQPIGRNVAIGLLLALLMLGGILLASLLTGHFVSDATKVPALRWVKGLTRGIWEEVFFRGIILVLFMCLYPRRKAVCLSAFVFAMMHFRVPTPKEGLAEIIWAQQTPGTNPVLSQALLFAFLWIALVVGAIVTRWVVERWPNRRPVPLEQSCT
jgi:membrane protease YdiL (CAAX protease family)